MKTPCLSTFYIVIMILISLGIIDPHEILKCQINDIKEVYYQDWTAGVKGGGGGLLCTVELLEYSSIKLDSIFFKGYSAKLLPIKNNTRVYKATIVFRNLNNYDSLQEDNDENTMSDDKLYQNNEVVFGMKLKPENCVLSYQEDTEYKYVKFDSIMYREDQLKQHRN